MTTELVLAKFNSDGTVGRKRCSPYISRMEMISVRFVNAICLACRKTVECPNLGDFSYGYLIFTGLYGTVYARAQVVGIPLVDEIWKIAESVIPPKDRRNMIQRVVAACADSIGGHSFTIDPICPHCLAPKVSLTDDYLPEFRRIYVATFEGYAVRSQSERMTMIRRIVY